MLQPLNTFSSFNPPGSPIKETSQSPFYNCGHWKLGGIADSLKNQGTAEVTLAQIRLWAPGPLWDTPAPWPCAASPFRACALLGRRGLAPTLPPDSDHMTP